MPGALPQQEQLAELVELAEPVQLGALVPTVVHLPELAIAEQPEPGPVRVEQAVATEPLEQGQGIVAAASFAGRVRPVQLGALVPTVVHLPELAIAEQPVQQQGAGVQIAG